MPLSLPPARPVPLLSYEEMVSILGEELSKVIHEDSYTPIIGVSMDSRNLFMGEMFLALDGERFRGIDFITPAYARGVRGFILAEQYFSELNRLPEETFFRCCFFLVKDPVIAYQLLAKHYLGRMGGFRVVITGSAGKTTAKEMLTRVWGGTYSVFCSYRNENNHLGVPKNVFLLQRQLIGGKAISVMIFELGMNHFGEIDSLASLVKPHLALITNILYAHIGNFSRREDIATAKGEVIPHLVAHPQLPDYPGGLLIFPEHTFGKDILYDRGHTQTLTPPPTIKEVKVTVTTTTRLDYQKDGKRSLLSQWKDSLTGEETEVPGFSVFLGETLSLVLEGAGVLGVPRDESFVRLAKKIIAETLDTPKPNSIPSPPFSEFPSAGSRLQIIDLPQRPLIIDDTYNANPDSMIKTVTALIALLPHTPSKVNLWVVLGDMLELGNFSRFLHERCGMEITEAVAKLSSEDRGRINFFLLGPEMKACYDNIDFPNKKYYAHPSSDDSTILQELHTGCNSDSVVFFKASHGMRFTHLLNGFLKGFVNSMNSNL